MLSPGVANGLPASVPEPAEWFLVAATIFLLLGHHVLANRRLASTVSSGIYFALRDIC